MDRKKEIGQRLKYAREKKGLQQKYVAKLLGVHNGTLSRIELGFHEPDAEKLKILSEVYEVSPEWILFGENKNDHLKLTEPELKVLTLFNSLSDEGKSWLLNTIEFMKKR